MFFYILSGTHRFVALRPRTRCHLVWIYLGYGVGDFDCFRRPIPGRARQLLVNFTSLHICDLLKRLYSVFKYSCQVRAAKIKERSIQYACLAKVVEGGLKIAIITRYSIVPTHSKCSPPFGFVVQYPLSRFSIHNRPILDMRHGALDFHYFSHCVVAKAICPYLRRRVVRELVLRRVSPA